MCAAAVILALETYTTLIIPCLDTHFLFTLKYSHSELEKKEFTKYIFEVRKKFCTLFKFALMFLSPTPTCFSTLSHLDKFAMQASLCGAAYSLLFSSCSAL